jgi:hypothetical protein
LTNSFQIQHNEAWYRIKVGIYLCDLRKNSNTIEYGLGYQDSANQKQDFPVAAMFVIRLR